MLLRRDTDQVGGDVDHLLANGDLLLADEHAGVVHGVGEVALHDEGLKAALHELGKGETKNVIKLALGLLEQTHADHAADEGLTYNHIKL